MKKRRSWLLSTIRLVICIAAIGYLVYSVPWHDRVRLGHADGPQVRLLTEEPGGFRVQHDGREVVLSATEVHHVQDAAGHPVPDIELGIPRVVRSTHLGLALTAIAIFGPVWFLQSFRLVLMVGLQGVRLRYWDAVKLTFAGNFFNFALPGSTGGDLVKAYYLTQYTHQKAEVVTSIVLDRIVGMVGMFTIAIGALLLAWDAAAFGDLLLPLAVVVLGLVGVLVTIFSRRLRRALHLVDLVRMLPLSELILRIGRAATALARHPSRVLSAYGVTLIMQAILMFSATVMGYALGMQGSVPYFFGYVAIGFVVGAVPLAPQGIGIVEVAYVRFFTLGGINTASQAVALALGVRLIQLVWAIPGVLVPLLGAHRPRPEELAALEAEAADAAAALERSAPRGDSAEATL
ncbi:MAG: flippase-like domain-containing protein [Phycisphaerales bacterium]|nr:flippase-like domain-containing protein [Phycisphaerales bacterium]